jgi:hypothetical protein
LRADNQRLKAQVRRLTERLVQYEPEIRQETTPAAAAEVRPTDYGLQGEAKRRHRRKRRRKKKSPGRRPTGSASSHLVPQSLVRGEQNHLGFSLGTPGLASGTFAKFPFSEQLTASAEIRFANGRTIKASLAPDD